MQENEIQLKKTARLAGLLYLIIALSGGYGLMYVPMQIYVAGDAAATSTNILDQEFLFRTGVFSNLVCQTVFVFLALTLYALFKNISDRLARTLVALVMVSVPIAFLIIFNQLYTIIVLKESFMSAFTQAQQQSLAMTFFKMYNYGNLVIGIFWGLWLIPFGQLVYRSGFMPKLLGILLVLGGVSYVIDASVFVLFPESHSLSNILVSIFSSVSELATVLWLLIIGVRVKRYEGA